MDMTPWMRLEALLTDWIPRYWAAGKSYVTVAFGCTGGRHRSVWPRRKWRNGCEGRDFPRIVRHRDLASQPSDTIEERPGTPKPVSPGRFWW